MKFYTEIEYLKYIIEQQQIEIERLKKQIEQGEY